MKSLSEILENNREVAKELMCKNHKLHISFKKYQNIDIEIPFVLLSNKNGEPYETEVTDIALIGEKLCIKVVNTKDLSSDVKMDDEGYIDCIFCIYYSDDEVYRAIECYFKNDIALLETITNLREELTNKFREVLEDEDERCFLLSSNNAFKCSGYAWEDNITAVFIENDNVLLKRTNSMLPIHINELSIDDMFILLKHIHSSVK
jgi:hypothetical protein